MPLAKIRSARSRISSLVTVLLMTRRRRSDPTSGAIVIVRSPLFRRRLRSVGVRSSRRSDEAREDLLDVGVVTQGDRHEARAFRVRARLLRELKDAVLGKRANRKIVVS